MIPEENVLRLGDFISERDECRGWIFDRTDIMAAECFVEDEFDDYDISDGTSFTTAYKLIEHAWQMSLQDFSEQNEDFFRTCIEQNADPADAFKRYDQLMRSLGFGIEGAEDFQDYYHIESRLNDVPSLNLTAFVKDTLRKETKFVKFFSDTAAYVKDITIQNQLSGCNAVNRATRIEAREIEQRTLDDITLAYSLLLDGMDTAGRTRTMHDLTMAWDVSKRRLAYGFYTDRIQGECLETALVNSIRGVKFPRTGPFQMPARGYYRVMGLLEQAVDTALELHDHANARIGSNPLLKKSLGRKDYVEHYLDWIGIGKGGLPNGRMLDYIESAGKIQVRLNSFMEDDRYRSFVHGDLHGKNIMIDEEGNMKIFDFERSSVGLKVEDLVRIYQIARNYGLHNHVKDYFFRNAFGDDYDREGCDEMFSLVTAQYYLENLSYYSMKLEDDKDNRVSWSKKRQFAMQEIRENILHKVDPADMRMIFLPHNPRTELSRIMNQGEDAETDMTGRRRHYRSPLVIVHDKRKDHIDIVFDVDGTLYEKKREYGAGNGSIEDTHEFLRYSTYSRMRQDSSDPARIAEEVRTEYREALADSSLKARIAAFPQELKDRYWKLVDIWGSNGKVFDHEFGAGSSYFAGIVGFTDFENILTHDQRLVDTIGYLKQEGYRLGIFTSEVYRTVERVLSTLGLSMGDFAMDTDTQYPILCAENVAVKKPGAEGFYRLVEVTGSPAGNIIYVGDSYTKDIAVPREIGMGAIHVTRNPRAEHEGYVHIPTIYSLTDIL